MAVYYADKYKVAAPIASQVNTNDSDAALKFLYQQIASGHPVIIDVNVTMEDPESITHFVVVTGVNLEGEGTITINNSYANSGNGDWSAAQQPFVWGTVWNSWSQNTDVNGAGWYMIVP